MRYPRDNTVRTLRNLTKPSWDDVEGKPFITKGGDTLYWDGSDFGHLTFNTNGATFIRVSSSVVKVGNNNRTAVAEFYSFSQLVQTMELNIMSEGDTLSFITSTGTPLVISGSREGVLALTGIELPAQGTWFVDMRTNDMDFHLQYLTINGGYNGFEIACVDRGQYQAIVLYADEDNYLYETTDTSDASKRLDSYYIFGAMRCANGLLISPPYNGIYGSILYKPLCVDGNMGINARLVALDEHGDVIVFKSSEVTS